MLSETHAYKLPEMSDGITFWTVPWIVIDTPVYFLYFYIFSHLLCLAFFSPLGVSVCLVSAPSHSAQQEHSPTWSPVVMEHRDGAVMCTSVSMVGLVSSVFVCVWLCVCVGEVHRWRVHIECYWAWTRAQEQSLLTELQWEDRVCDVCMQTY